MSISETCGNCGSSVEFDRSDEVQLWREWQKKHVCKAPDKESFFSAAQPMIEQSESKLGFQRPEVEFDE